MNSRNQLSRGLKGTELEIRKFWIWDLEGLVFAYGSGKQKGPKDNAGQESGNETRKEVY